jgi:putative hydrolase of the HAD superfamily
LKRYGHLFFDLDHTLWDFKSNSRETLRELHQEEKLGDLEITEEAFIAAYEEVNEGLWGRYEAGHLSKDVLRVLRFRNALLMFGVRDNALSNRLGHAYLEKCPTKPLLMPGTLGLLQDLSPHYRMHIMTNGFQEVQTVKIRSSGITELFSSVICSEKAGAKKPDPRIFKYALKVSKAQPHECLMIGDSPAADMLGARRAGWDHVHFAADCEPDPEATHAVCDMEGLRRILLA